MKTQGASSDNSCLRHGEVAYRIDRLSVRMDRIEIGIVGVLFLLVAQLWMLYDLPGKIKNDRRHDDATASIFIDSANAQGK